jgi:HEAT repeat protein
VESASIEVEETPVEAEPALVETSNALSEATSQYLEAPIHEREGAQRALHSAVDASRTAGAFGEIASNVNVLILQGAGDSDTWDLADEFIDDEVLAEMVVQLGGVRDEEEREALIQAFMKLGDRVAEVIADTLTDTEDRLARKTYVAALGAFGAAGAQAVEKMLRDSRWFVVRNGVAVLGVVGGPSAIEHLMGSLANKHAKVRRETVRSLAKIGGENAESLVSSMLGDSDSKVRAAAARAVSALKTERAYKQLIEILKQGDEEAVIEQVLRALGALGDPSAVPAIEKQVKGTLFSRSPTGVRVAGLTALAAIGTPHAMSLVKKARTDKDPDISSAAAQLLSGK